MRCSSIRAAYEKCFKMLGVVPILIAYYPQPAVAEELPEGMVGWWYFINVYEYGFVSDPVTACTLTAKNHHNRELLDIKPRENGSFFDCKYLHPFQAMNDLKGRQWYSFTWLQCRSGYYPRSPGVCVKNQEPPPPASCNESSPGYALGNPVTVSTGAKIQTEIDFLGTPAGALQIARTYRPFSQFISGQSAGTNWSFSFDRVLTIQRWSDDGRPLTLLGTAGDASQFSFYWNATKAVYESTFDRTATLVPLSANYDEWLMVKNGGRTGLKST